MGGKATEYIPWPGAGMPPGERTNPGGNKTAPDSKIVHGRYGWEWTEDESQATGDVKAAVDAAKGIQRFINISTDQLTVTGTAFINEAIIQKIWTRIITAKEGEFGKLKAGMIEAHHVIADEVRAGAIDGMVITGALFQTKKYGQYPRIAISSDGMYVWDKNNRNTLSINNDGTIWIDGQVGISDSWSWSNFVDLKANDTNTDIGGDGRRVGVGIQFQRRNNPYTMAGSITIVENASGMPRLDFQAPSRRAGEAPRFELSENRIAIVSSVSRGGAVLLDSDGVYLQANGRGALYSGYDNFFVRSGRYSSGTFGLRGNKDGIYLSWDSNCSMRQYTSQDTRGQMIELASSSHFVQILQGHHDNYNITVAGSTWVFGKFGANNKTFIIEHPLDPYGKMLMHSCTESPWPGVEYWDTVTVGEDGAVEVVLPDYFNALYRPDLPLAVLCSGPGSPWATRVVMGRFTVHGEPGVTVSWLVKAVRRADHTRTLDRDHPPVEAPAMRPAPTQDGDVVTDPKDLRWLYEPPVPTE
jgi:hypothetical protein